MTGNQIVAKIKDNGLTMMDIAKREKVSHTAIRLTVFGPIRSERLRRVVALAAGASEKELWPEPRPKRGRPPKEKVA